MKREQFDDLFQSDFVEPLTDLGFQTSGKSVYLVKNHSIVGLLRLGGRFSFPSSISYVLCFRHTFLRDTKEQIPFGFVSELFSYPYKFSLNKLQGLDNSQWHYEPHNLRYPYDRYSYEKFDAKQVKEWLRETSKFVGNSFVQWCDTITPERVLSQIQQYGESAWCERMWVEDYKMHISHHLTNAKISDGSFN